MRGNSLYDYDLRPKRSLAARVIFRGGATIGIVAVVVGLVFLIAVGVDGGCTAPDRTYETLDKAGYKHIEVGGHSWFECGEDDTFATEFTAVNPSGRRVSGTVCCGLVAKGCTIRF